MEMEPGKLFIGGISWDTNEDRLREYFESFGQVLEAVIMKDRATGRARGFGFVVFADPAVAERVVQERHVIDGRTVEAKKAVPRDDQNILNRNNSSVHGLPGLARTKKIFVGGLASTVTENDFRKYFEQFGMITDVVVMYDHNTQRPRGFGFITYDSEEAVDKVLVHTFHELNGKMVEVKRAVPKELSPGPTRGQSSGYNYSPSRVSNLLNGYTMGYNQGLVGGFGARMDGRFSPSSAGRGALPPIGPGYGTGLNIQGGLSPGYGGNTDFSSTIDYGRGWNPLYGGRNFSRLGSPIGFGGVGGVNSTLLSSPGRNLWENGNLSYSLNSGNLNALTNSVTGNPGMGSFDNLEAIWGSSSNSGSGGGFNSTFSSGSLGYGNGSAIVGYGRNSGNGIAQPSSYSASSGGYDGPYAGIRESTPTVGDPNWHSSPTELDRSSSFDYGLGNAASDFMSKSASGYVGGYSVADRQTNRGIAA